MQKKLPLSKSSRSSLLVALPTAILLLAIAVLQVSLLGLSLIYALRVDILLAAIYLGLASFLFWGSGALYITLPLHIYFSVKYKGDSNFALVDYWHRRALRLIKELRIRPSMTVATCISNLGLLRMCQGHYESASELFADAKNYLEKQPSAVRDLCHLVIENNRAVSLIRLGSAENKENPEKYIEAEMIATDLLDLCEKPSMKKDYAMLKAAPLAVLAAVQTRLGEYEKASLNFKQSLDLYLNAPIPKHYSADSFKQAIAFEYLGLAYISLKQNKKQESLKELAKAFGELKSAPGQINPLSLEPINFLASQYIEQKMYEPAEELLELGYTIGKENPFHPDAIKLQSSFANLLRQTGRENELPDLKSWLLPVECRLLLDKAPGT